MTRAFNPLVDVAPGLPNPDRERGILTRAYEAWNAGEVPIDDIRDHLEDLWLQMGTALEGPELVALLRAAGPIVGRWSAPWIVNLPATFSVYQGRCEGEELGVGWTPSPIAARGYAEAWHERRRERDAKTPPPIVYRARATPELVLLRTRRHFVIDPADLKVTPVRRDPPPDAWVREPGDSFRFDDGIPDVRAYFADGLRSYWALALRIGFDEWPDDVGPDFEAEVEKAADEMYDLYRRSKRLQMAEVMLTASRVAA